MAIKSIFIRVGGRVQGVGFRYFAKLKADELLLKGWVQNIGEQYVEIEAEGEPANIDVFADWIKIGPPMAVVKTFAIAEINPRNFSSFRIR